MGLDFGPHADVVFDRAPLATVLTQIRFPAVLSLLAPAGLAGFQMGVREEYPTLLPTERSASVSIGVDKVGVEAAPPVWRLTDEGRKWTVGLAVDFVSLETSAYAGTDDFLARLTRVLKVLRRTIRPAESVRVGLRKVNEVQVPSARETQSLLGIVRAEMLGPLAVESFPAPISSSSAQLSFRDDFHTLAVRYGLSSPTEDVTNFVLDIDYYNEQPYTVDAADGLLGLLRYFSEGSTSFFHWALEDEYSSHWVPRTGTRRSPSRDDVN